MFKLIKCLKHQYQLDSGKLDQPRDKPGSFRSPVRRLDRLWPEASDYQIIEFPDRTVQRYGLQANVNGKWIEMLYYDNGYDDFGKLLPGRWRPISRAASWDIGSLRGLIRDIKGLPEEVRVVHKKEAVEG